VKKFRLDDRLAIITGGAGLLGVQYADAIAEVGGIPVLWDINEGAAKREAGRIQQTFKVPSRGMNVNITNSVSIEKGLSEVLSSFGHVDILINNAANDPKVKTNQDESWSRFENYKLEMWDKDISVGLTGAFLCCQIVGSELARQGKGVILNIASDLAVISPDQRIYKKDGIPDHLQQVKPVTYSVVKHGITGLTKYLATYWADKGVRINVLCPGGVYDNQPDEFVRKLSNLIPMGRMADKDEYKSAIQFLISDASSYMTGAVLVMDGGRTIW
jgi:NAD(P)-dependent dehydrogenase (short-subunit alcohol dehydrogenase family)